MLTSARASVANLLKDVYPTLTPGVTLLAPDDSADFEKALGPPNSSNVVVRYYQPQLMRAGTIAEFMAFVDVCARRLSTASSAAQELLDRIPTTPRNPTTMRDPRAVPIKETSYYRVAVTFTLNGDSNPEPQGS